ncbi:MAG: hypothetical protein KAI91_06905, partial [Candidatus Omnitrophica bacterium]|nr:hypothetical protein [Candidatus Omnitrophota bacterium]
LIKIQILKKVSLVKMRLQDYTGGVFSQVVYWQFLPKSRINNCAHKSIKDFFLYQSTIKSVNTSKFFSFILKQFIDSIRKEI